MPNGEDTDERSGQRTRAAATTAATAVKWGLRSRWLLGCVGCGGGCKGCFWVLVILFAFIIIIVVLYYLCHEFLGGAGAWVEATLAQAGLSLGICNLLR